MSIRTNILSNLQFKSFSSLFSTTLLLKQKNSIYCDYNSNNTISRNSFFIRTFSNNQYNVDPDEIKKFTKNKEGWWETSNSHGSVGKGLQEMNTVRVMFIKQQICDHFERDPSSSLPFWGLRILDVGCGGGILSESLVRLGANVVGIDPGKENIQAAKQHSSSTLNSEQLSRLTYLNFSSQHLMKILEENEKNEDTEIEDESGNSLRLDQNIRNKFSVVCSLEVVEHVPSVNDFIKSLSFFVEQKGMVFMSTINKTQLSYLIAIQVAENILGWLPKGTHDWNKFIEPNQLASHLYSNHFTNVKGSGMIYNPIIEYLPQQLPYLSILSQVLPSNLQSNIERSHIVNLFPNNSKDSSSSKEEELSSHSQFSSLFSKDPLNSMINGIIGNLNGERLNKHEKWSLSNDLSVNYIVSAIKDEKIE